MTHKLSRLLLLAASSVAISIAPLSADNLQNYLNGTDSGSNGNTFTDGSLSITFTGYSDTVTCSEGVTVVACNPTDYAPLAASTITINPSDGGSSLLNPAVPGFVLSGTFLAQSYLDPTTGQYVNVDEDIQLTYTVTDTQGAINGIDLALGSPVINPSGAEPPEINVGESTSQFPTDVLQVTDPPPTTVDTLTLPTTASTLTVSKDITLISGAGQNYKASFSALEQGFNTVPEPRAYAAVLGLLFALFFVIKRRRQQTA